MFPARYNPFTHGPRALPSVVVLCAVAFVGSCVTSGAARVEPPQIPGATYVGNEACATCHEEVAARASRARHGRLTVEQRTGTAGTCEGCHGPGSVHANSSDPRDIWSFKRLDPEQQVAVCTRCHDGRAYAHFLSASHSANDMSCATCHPSHPENSATPRAAQPELCYSCHANIRAKANLPSHHPIREGRMQCTDCHNLHGPDAGESIGGRTNDRCTKCHREKEGPFTFEHAAVVEDCAACHDPHGTVVNNLLKKTEPYLCLGCHHVHFQIKEHADVRATASQRCTQCHTAIHGSDLPSLVKSAAGRSLIP